MKPDSLAVVQFIHPGKEQTKEHEGWCKWNSAVRSDGAWPHRRKFIIAEASYVKNDSPTKGLVGFWGEWEGPSRIVDRMAPAPNGNPRYHHVPAYYEPESYEGLLDTDPFVFGDRFLYCGCQQHTAHNRPGGATETFLRRLDVGSLILFGSSINKRFVLDTAFVVGDFVDYSLGVFDGLEGLVPDEFYALSLHSQTLGNPTCDSFRLYRGATRESPVNGMFSFSPCRPYDGSHTGFERPHLELPGIVTQNLTQGKKRTCMKLDGVRCTWDEVVNQVSGRLLGLAHNIELNPIRVKRRS